MNYIDRNLIPGETVIYETRLHWVVIIRHIILAAVFALAGMYLLSGMPGTTGLQGDPSRYARIGGGVLFGFAVISAILAMVRRNSVEMAVTNKRVTVKVGLVSHSTEEMMLNRIESIMVDQSLMGRILGYGTITLRGVGGTPDPFPSIAHPLEFRRQVQQQLDAQQIPSPLSMAQRPQQ
jgi:uncharacterized membrane protein YdbT with pleckstrin-like domain